MYCYEMIDLKNKVLFKLTIKWILGLGVLGLTCFPIIIEPMMDPDKYKDIQKVARAGIVQENIQPGNMRVWSDPFGKKRE